MPAGEEAAAAGLPVMPATKDVRVGYDDVNNLADHLARHQVSGTHQANKITGQFTSAQIQDGAVIASKIPNLTIGDEHVLTGTLGDRVIRDGAVTAPKIAAGAVGASAIANGALPVDKLAKRYRAGRVTVTAGAAGLVLGQIISHGLSGTPALLVTPATDGAEVWSVPRSGGTAEIYARALSGSGGWTLTVSWLAVEV